MQGTVEVEETEETVAQADPEEFIGGTDEVAEEVSDRLVKSYMNDTAGVLEATEVDVQDPRGRSGSEIVIRFETLYGDGACERRFDCPEEYSLTETEELVEFLNAVGVSPLQIEEIIGKRVPAVHGENGWEIDVDEACGIEDGTTGRSVGDLVSVDTDDLPMGLIVPMGALFVLTAVLILVTTAA